MEQQTQNTEPGTITTATIPETQWGPDAPKGARAVFSRFIKEGANVPLFLGQTMVSALRDLGYNHTTSAICEHVDNSFQWGAQEVRVYFHERVRKGTRKIDVLVIDNGVGMSPNVLRAVTAFGGSLCYEWANSLRFAVDKWAGFLTVMLSRRIPGNISGCRSSIG